MPSEQVLLAQRLAMAAQEEPRCSVCTLKPRAAAVVRKGQQVLRLLVVLVVVRC
jgi:hypothetical protein